MSADADIVGEWLAAADTHGGVVPSDDTLRAIAGLTRAESEALLEQWGEWPDDVVVGTVERLADISSQDAGVEFDELFASCMFHPLDEVREQSVSAVSGNGDSRMIDALSDLLLADSSDEVRAAAAVALGAYADFAEAGRVSPQRVDRLREVLEVATDDPATSVAGAALIAYSGLPDGEPSEVIERKFDADSEDSDALAFSYAAMGRSSERHWLPEVLHALDHPSAKVRAAATLAFGDLADPDDGLGYLETLLDDDELDVQLAAVAALRTIGTSDARAMLTQTIELTSEPDVRDRAEQALEQLREDDQLHQAVTSEMMESGLYGGGGTAAAPERDLARYDAPTEEGWARLGDAGTGQDEDIGEDMEDYYESEEFWRG